MAGGVMNVPFKVWNTLAAKAAAYDEGETLEVVDGEVFVDSRIIVGSRSVDLYSELPAGTYRIVREVG